MKTIMTIAITCLTIFGTMTFAHADETSSPDVVQSPGGGVDNGTRTARPCYQWGGGCRRVR